MGNIIDYLNEYGSRSLEEIPFKREDALCLAQLCYLKYDRLMDEMSETRVSLENLNKHAERELLFSNKWHRENNKKLLDAFLKADRFKGLKLCFYINKIDEEEEVQFSAVTFILPDGETVITFRGTDENMVGWQEDVNLALRKPVSGQKLSLKYISEVASKIDGPLIVEGHSKGGNLAMYASMCCDKSVQDRICKIYSFDGPGFRQTFLNEHNYAEIKEKIERVIPKSSFVGLMLAADKEHMVVEAKEVGFAQHIPFTWVIENGNFVEGKLNEQHERLLASFNETILSLNDEEVEKFVRFLNDLMIATEAKTTTEFSEATMKHMNALIKNSKDIDEDTKKLMGMFVKSYFETVGESIDRDMKEKQAEFKKKVESAFEEYRGNFEEYKVEIEDYKEELQSKIKRNIDRVKNNKRG